MTLPSDMLNLEGLVVLVTGASSGIGAASARLLGQQGATLWLIGRDETRLDQVAATIEQAHVLPLDITDEAAVKAAIMRVRKESGQLDCLVNNAGIMEGAMIAATPTASLQRMLSINVEGAYRMAQLASRLMSAKKQGSIINMTSIMGVEGASGYSAYSASKAAVVGMTRAMARELAPSNIRVNALAPGFVETALTEGINDDARAKVLGSIGMGRFGTPEDVANAVLFLASPLSAYVTGQIIGVDGMMTP